MDGYLTVMFIYLATACMYTYVTQPGDLSGILRCGSGSPTNPQGTIHGAVIGCESAMLPAEQVAVKTSSLGSFFEENTDF